MGAPCLPCLFGPGHALPRRAMHFRASPTSPRLVNPGPAHPPPCLFRPGGSWPCARANVADRPRAEERQGRPLGGCQGQGIQAFALEDKGPGGSSGVVGGSRPDASLGVAGALKRKGKGGRSCRLLPSYQARWPANTGYTSTR